MIAAASEYHIAEVLNGLCAQNVAEFEVMQGGYDPVLALELVQDWIKGEGAVGLVVLKARVAECVGGLRPINPGVAIFWLLGTTGWPRRCLREVTQAGRTLVETALANGYHRLEGHALSTNQFSGRWYRKLGFEREGVRRSFGRRGEDVEIYGRVKHGIG
ncbi:GNAT family N-acetyltransferase [Microbulbifer sp. 2201CG32-9]|uniref:GNAT family N-acetyltransferase n=1 Tax=Microbulbifer sp. 2201CG32-9 TaxID=3232309 RepID=UPI00345BE220